MHFVELFGVSFPSLFYIRVSHTQWELINSVKPVVAKKNTPPSRYLVASLAAITALIGYASIRLAHLTAL